MMYLATCSYRKVAFSKFFGCHAGRMMCPTRRSKACDLAIMREMRQGRGSSKQERPPSSSQLTLSKSGRSRWMGRLMQLYTGSLEYVLERILGLGA